MSAGTTNAAPLPDSSAPDETVLAHAAANLIRGIEAVGGRLTVTNRRVMFQPHPVNVQKASEEILLSEIVAVGKHNTLGVVPNGLFIRTRDGAERKFVLWRRRRMIGLLESQLLRP